MNTPEDDFPSINLPPIIGDAVDAMVALYGFQPGAAGMALLTFFGAAVGGRVKVSFLSREHGLNLPLTLVMPPVTEMTGCLDRFKRTFQEEVTRLADLRRITVAHWARAKRCRERLNLSVPEVAPTPVEAAELRTQMRELEAMDAHDILSLERVDDAANAFDGHLLLYCSSGYPFAHYLEQPARRAALTARLDAGFLSPTACISAVVQAPVSLVQKTVEAWKSLEPGWITVLIESPFRLKEAGDKNAADAAIKRVNQALQDQLRMRIERDPVMLRSDEASLPAVNEFLEDFSQLASEMSIPGAYQHFLSVMARVAGTLHVVEQPEATVPSIEAGTWRRAGAITAWALRAHHRFLTSSLPTKQESAPPPRAKPYCRSTSLDASYFITNLGRVQPSTWRRLLQRLPKRRPGYWAEFREALIRDGCVRETAGMLVVTDAAHASEPANPET